MRKVEFLISGVPDGFFKRSIVKFPEQRAACVYTVVDF